jgi:hypothetical protein
MSDQARLSCGRAHLYGRSSFQDKAAGSSPARPTTPLLSCGNARRWPPSIATASVRRLRIAVRERIPVLLSPEGRTHRTGVPDEITEFQALLGDANPSLPSFFGDIRERWVVAAVTRALQAGAGCRSLLSNPASPLVAGGVGCWRAREMSDPKRRCLRVQAGHAGWLRP